MIIIIPSVPNKKYTIVNYYNTNEFIFSIVSDQHGRRMKYELGSQSHLVKWTVIAKKGMETFGKKSEECHREGLALIWRTIVKEDTGILKKKI